MEELKKCPFCGGEADCSESMMLSNGSFEWAVECVECGAITCGFKTPRQAMQAWNKRVE